VKFYVRDSYEIPNLVKIEKNIYENLHAGLRAHCIVEGSEKYFVARQHCKGNPLLLFRGNTQQLYIIGICNNEKETHYCVTVATLVTRKCQIFTWYVRGPSFFNLFQISVIDNKTSVKLKFSKYES